VFIFRIIIDTKEVSFYLSSFILCVNLQSISVPEMETSKKDSNSLKIIYFTVERIIELSEGY
jgi:hypothetical protein